MQFGAEPNSRSTARRGEPWEQNQPRFSDKCKRLRTLLNEGKIPNSENAKDLLAQIENYGRNIFTHSFLASDEHSVTFIHRKVERGKYMSTGYTIPRDDFIDHVQNFVQLSFDFENAVGLTHEDVADFAAMAKPLAPQRPTDIENKASP